MDGGALERKLAQSKLDAAQRQLHPAREIIGFLIASPVVIGTLLLGFVVAA